MRISRTTALAVATMALSAVLTGCATYSAAGAAFRCSSPHLEVALPAGWLEYRPAKPHFTITRDGLRLERIEIAIIRENEKVEGTERTYQPGMMPHEIAELSLGLIGGGGVSQFAIEKIEAAAVMGIDGYRAEASCVDDHGLPVRILVYGVATAERVCEFRYAAARDVYYERYLPEFEQVVLSARVSR